MAHSPVPADHSIRFLFAQQWDKEVPRELIVRVQSQLIEAHLQQPPEPLRGILASNASSSSVSSVTVVSVSSVIASMQLP